MVDRIEELLAMMAAEDEEDSQEDAPALDRTAALTSLPQETGEGAAAGEADSRPDAGTGQEPEGVGLAPALEDLTAGGRRALENDPDGEAARQTEWDAILTAKAAVRKQTAETVQEAVSAVREAGELAGALPGRQAGAGLEKLYRQTAQAAAPTAPALPPGRAGRTVLTAEPGSAASLAVDELDRAVRRDSRRYDGGMMIF